MIRYLLAAATLLLATSAWAQNTILEAGTWIKREGSATRLALTIEAAGGARKLTYRLRNPDGSFDKNFGLTVQTQLDGSDAPVLAQSKPTGETMGIKRLDARHSHTVLKMNGKQFGVSRAELSADGKVMTVENEYTSAAAGHAPGKQVEHWDKR